MMPKEQETGRKKPLCFKLVVLIIFILALTAIVIVSILRDRIVNDYGHQVSVNGRGEISYQPDVAKVTLGVQVDQSPRAEGALQSLNQKVKKVMAALESLGIDRTDIRTDNYSLYPSYNYTNGRQVLAGYNANQQVEVKVRSVDQDIELLNQVLARASEAGANQINSLTFESSRIEELKQEARFLAVANAKNKAETLAREIGLSLGKIINWWENDSEPALDYYRNSAKVYLEDQASGVSEADISAGTYKITVDLSLSYKVK